MRSIRDFDLDNKTVIIRCDFNVPTKNSQVIDDTRVVSALPTISYALDKGAKIILLSHMGRIKTKEDLKDNSLKPVCDVLEKKLNKKILFSKNVLGDDLFKKAHSLKKGDILLVENTRFSDLDGNLESGNVKEYASFLASLGDIFINDAYASMHRNHASVVGICDYLPSGIGFLVEEEFAKINEILKENTHPLVILMGGKKISDKIKLTENLIKKCDKILIGGALAYTFFYAMGYNTGANLVDLSSASFCSKILRKYPDKIVLPEDAITKGGKVKKISSLSENDICYDIGPKTIKLFEKNIRSSKRIIINGPMGVFEDKNFETGTRELYQYIISKKIKTLVGGGDSTSAVKRFGFDNEFYHISTGGGATLEYLSGFKLVGLEAIKKSSK